MKSYLLNLANRAAGLGPWAEMQSPGNVRPGFNPSMVLGLGAVEPLADHFEWDGPTLAARAIFDEAEDGPQARTSAGPVLTAAKSAPEEATPSSIEGRPGISVERIVSRSGTEALKMPSVRSPAPPVRPEISDDQSEPFHTDSGSLARERGGTAPGGSPDIVVRAAAISEQDPADRRESRPSAPIRPTVEPAAVRARTRNEPRGYTENVPDLSAATVPPVSTAGDTITIPTRQEAPEPSTSGWAARRNGQGARVNGRHNHEISQRPPRHLLYSEKLTDSPRPETGNKSIPRVRSAADPSAAQLAAALAGLSTAGPGEGDRKPNPDPAVTVRIGRVEVRAAHRSANTPPSPVAGSTPPPSGFGEYRSLRNYEHWEP